MLYCFLAEGFEEIEAIATVDTVLRGGIEIATVGIGGRTVKGSHGIPVVADLTEDEINYSDMTGVILPGGIPGTPNLEKSETVRTAVTYAAENGLLVCAICAAPSILGKLGLLRGKKAVCYDGFEKYLTGAEIPDCRVVTDGNFITGRAAGTAIEFGLEIVGAIKGTDAANSVGISMKCKR